jgi:ferritin-like metal-binding protein YciE
MKTLQDLFLAELADIYDAECRLVSALPKMAKAATCDQLRETILAHLEETKGHVAKVEEVFECFDTEAERATCEATVGLLREGEDLSTDFKGSPAINAALISVVQKVEHYEIASYGCLRAWAGELGNKRASDLLKEILIQEMAVDESLSELALSSSNPDALGELADDDETETAGPVAPTPRVAREPVGSI